MTQATRATIATAATTTPTPTPAFALPFREDAGCSTAADGVFDTVTVALETMDEAAIVLGCEEDAAALVADCEDAAASNCSGAGALNVSFVGLSQAVVVPQQAHKYEVEL